jgi:quinol monooxygenase YgiN
MPIYMTAQWQCRSGAEETVAAALREFVAAVGRNETGTRIYTALQEVSDSTRFMTSFVFEDEAARQLHQSTEWVKQFTDVIYPLNEGEVLFTEHHLVASTSELFLP